MVAKYRKKPIVIEASQWVPVTSGGDHAAVGHYRTPDGDAETPCKHCGCRMHDHGWIDTLEGGHIVCHGDWIITGIKGEIYPCKPDIFEATYEPVAPNPKGE
ncbi:hypothetical protein LCGC14_1789580 [marine sediment metagenome]|uniref:Uncharacterized protein n=1 Tax=marine sediment metagenome TaxID=412755 RepID=A0A0F9HFI6_9ZZZZ